MSREYGYLNMDTERCADYTARMGQVKQLYETVLSWEREVKAKAAEETIKNTPTALDGPEALVKAAKWEAAMARLAACKALEGQMGTKCVTRLMNHFSETANRVSEAENRLCSEGEALFRL